MIAVNDLRIGNWVMFGVNHVDIKAIHQDSVLQDKEPHVYVGNFARFGTYCLKLSQLEPTPLTPKIFDKCGFDLWDRKLSQEYSKEVGNDGFKIKGIFNREYKSFQLLLVGNGAYDELGETDLTDNCNSLHQLQNLYYALTRKELEIKL